jgi:signal peptidase I
MQYVGLSRLTNPECQVATATRCGELESLTYMTKSSIQAACRLAVGVCLIALVTHTWLLMGLVVPVTVAGSSMTPTLQNAHRLLIDRTAFLFRGPQRWEVVVFRSPQDARRLCVKRVVGLPGETISLVDGDVLVDGQHARSPYDIGYEFRYGDNPKVRGDVRLGPTEYIVLGDNAAISDDSRNWSAGPALDAKLLIGRPLGVR